jgi:hypothetical protein
VAPLGDAVGPALVQVQPAAAAAATPAAAPHSPERQHWPAGAALPSSVSTLAASRSAGPAEMPGPQPTPQRSADAGPEPGIADHHAVGAAVSGSADPLAVRAEPGHRPTALVDPPDIPAAVVKPIQSAPAQQGSLSDHPAVDRPDTKRSEAAQPALLVPRPASADAPTWPRASHRAGPAAAMAADGGRDHDQTAEVHIHIGRIDVTAVQEAAPARRRPAAAQPTTSLDAYLARRKSS